MATEGNHGSRGIRLVGRSAFHRPAKHVPGQLPSALNGRTANATNCKNPSNGFLNDAFESIFGKLLFFQFNGDIVKRHICHRGFGCSILRRPAIAPTHFISQGTYVVHSTTATPTAPPLEGLPILGSATWFRTLTGIIPRHNDEMKIPKIFSPGSN